MQKPNDVEPKFFFCANLSNILRLGVRVKCTQIALQKFAKSENPNFNIINTVNILQEILVWQVLLPQSSVSKFLSVNDALI